MRDLYRNLLPVPSIYAAAYTAAHDGDAYVDLLGFQGALIEIGAGDIPTGGATYEFEVKESNDHVTFTAVAAAHLSGTEPTFADTDDNTIKTLGYIGGCRYLRVDLKAVTGTPGTGGNFFANVIKGFPIHAPAV